VKHTKILLSGLSILTMLSFDTVPVHAAMTCGTRSFVAKQLERRYAEQTTGVGTVGPNLLQLYTSKDGTFTIVVTRADGTSCLLLAGENWRAVTPKDPQS